MGARGCLPGSKVDGACVDLYFQLVLRLRRSGAIPTFILHLFVACTRTTLHSLPFSENLIMREAV